MNKIKKLDKYEEKLYIQMYMWWRKHLNLPENCSDTSFAHALYKDGQLSPTSIRFLAFEKKINKELIYVSVINGFDMSTETGCYIKLYD